MLTYFSSSEFLAGMLPVVIISVSSLLLFYTRRREREGKYGASPRSLPDKKEQYLEAIYPDGDIEIQSFERTEMEQN